MKFGARLYEILAQFGNERIAIPKLCFAFQLHKQILGCQKFLDKKEILAYHDKLCLCDII